MRLFVASDIHFEFMQTHALEDWWTQFEVVKARYEEPDALVLAGDICPVSDSCEHLALEVMKRFTDNFNHVLYVMGNHCYYGTSIQEGTARVLGWGFSNLTLLANNSATINGQKFWGGTGWYPDYRDAYVKATFPDYRFIKDHEQIYTSHEQFVQMMGKVQVGDIVVSHHLPSHRSTPVHFQASALNPYFVMPQIVEDMIRSRRPKMYIHGHTHDAFRYTIGNTTVYCNPSGYPRENANPKFFKKLVVAV